MLSARRWWQLRWQHSLPACLPALPWHVLPCRAASTEAEWQDRRGSALAVGCHEFAISTHGRRARGLSGGVWSGRRQQRRRQARLLRQQSRSGRIRLQRPDLDLRSESGHHQQVSLLRRLSEKIRRPLEWPLVSNAARRKHRTRFWLGLVASKGSVNFFVGRQMGFGLRRHHSFLPSQSTPGWFTTHPWFKGK